MKMCKHYIFHNNKMRNCWRRLSLKLYAEFAKQHIWFEQCKQCKCVREKRLISVNDLNGPKFKIQTRILPNEYIGA